MKYYKFLSGLPLLNKYSYKFLFVSFLGIHVPLIGLILFIVLGPAAVLEPGTVIGITLLLTLAATGVTLYVLHRLISPIRLVKSALHEYLTMQKLPTLPTHYKDEVGVLMHDVQHTITEVSSLLEEKRDLLAMLTHDLRSPNINIQQAMQLTKGETDPAITEQLYRSVEHSAEKQLALIEAVTGLWRHESTGVQLYDLQRVQLSSVLSEVLRQHDATLARKQLVVQSRVPEGIYACAEPDLIAEVFSNVLFNAIKFSRPGGEISLWSEEGNGSIKVFVRDQGLGFRPEQAEALFQRFTPFRKRGTGGEGTIGLGLYLCRKMLHKQGGSITAHSPGEGQGAVFTVELRAADAC
ncbi:sensor histidine kinase [Pontibacter toksunensis]|uniref:histidine kinase n=1 Tax=Pontibacter toksunensis TaxID=1332631 RepID=A0ABW6C1V1_9BACT